MIELKNLTKVYGTVNYNVIALSDINYNLEKGEVVVLLGRSGSGKSTLLNILGGFDREYAGKFILDGENMREKTEREIDTIRKRRIGFVFQQYVLLNNLTVLENVEIALKVIGVVNAGSRKRAALHALKLVGLRDHADKHPYELSGGQKQRVAIARAFVKNPDIIIADEPTAALDSRTSKEILDLLKDLCRTKLLIIATHNKAIVRDYGSRVIELKSGYTIKNELITDPSKIRVDELDLIIDREISEDDVRIQKMIDMEEKVTEVNKETVLKDLGVDLENFKLNNQNEFDIDEELKRRLIKERMRNTKLNTRIYRFLQTSDNFHGKKKYANQSFLRNIGLHVFSALIFTVFLLTIVFGLNFVTETFGGFNEKAMYTRTMTNENRVYYIASDYEMDDLDRELHEDLEFSFISDFSQTDTINSHFIDELLIDPYFNYQYDQDRILHIKNELEDLGLSPIFAVYYNNSSIILKQSNPDIVFEELQYIYQNIVQYPEPYTYVTDFMGVDLDADSIYQYNYVYSENNADILNDHMLEGSRLPENDDEVVVPVDFLFKYEIITPDEFKDEHGNILKIIPSALISEKFLEMDEADREITITRNIITFEDDGDSYTESYQEVTHTFTVVGLINFDGDINPFIDLKDDVFMPNVSSESFSFIFSQDAEEYITFEIVDNSTYGEFTKAIQYAEISLENYKEFNVDDIERDFLDNYIPEIKEDVAETFELWIDTLNEATEQVALYVESDLSGAPINNAFLTDLVDNEMFEGLRYIDILHMYVAQHAYVISDRDEYEYLTNQSYINRDYESLLAEADSIYNKLKTHSTFKDALEVFGDFSRLTYQETTNRIIYTEYAHLFNNQFYESAQGNFYNLNLVSSFERERGSLSGLVYLVVPRVLVENIGFIENFVKGLSKLEQSPGFIKFMENTNLDLLISSISTNAVRSLVMIVLYLVVYLVLIFSVIFLSIVLINLYGNIYETATRKRVKELASLRVLGTSHEDIYDMVRLENKRVALFSFISFFGIMLILSNLNLYTNAPISHYYMPLLGLFFDFNLYDVFAMNYVVIFFATLVFYFFIYKYIIKRVSTKKITNIDTIKAIKDGDNL